MTLAIKAIKNKNKIEKNPSKSLSVSKEISDSQPDERSACV